MQGCPIQLERLPRTTGVAAVFTTFAFDASFVIVLQEGIPRLESGKFITILTALVTLNES